MADSLEELVEAALLNRGQAGGTACPTKNYMQSEVGQAVRLPGFFSKLVVRVKQIGHYYASLVAR